MTRPAPRVPLPWGDVVDRLTILEIKVEKLTSPAARGNALEELRQLHLAVAETSAGFTSEEITALGFVRSELKVVNRFLWDAENAVRRYLSSIKEFPEGIAWGPFSQTAAEIFEHNDRRAALKRRINDLVGSELVEEKEHR